MGALAERLTLLRTAMQTQIPARVVTRDLRDYGDRPEADLKRGVLTIISTGEQGLQNNPGREAHYGRHAVIVIGQILAPSDKAPGGTVEDLEHGLVEDVKRFCRLPPPVGIDTLVMNAWRGSAQLDAPYGSVVIEMEMMGE